MRVATLLAVVLMTICVGTAVAQPPGINLSWDDCNASLAGGLNKTSTCLSNTEATKSLFGSYVLPADADALSGNEIVMEIMTNSATLPCWWNFTVAPRTTAYSVDFTTPCANNAYDYWGTIQGGAVGGAVAQLMPTAATPRIRIQIVAAITPGQEEPLPASVGEIFSFRFRLRHIATVGSCTGCTTPACFVLKLIRVTQAGFPSMELTNASSRLHAFWQGGVVQAPGCIIDPAVNKTWGSVKALYR